MTNQGYDVVIVGGGASGLCAAVSYLRRADAGRLLLLEAKGECGLKILATGNGRCNVSNLSADDYGEAKAFFESLGVLFRVEEGGRAYPMSGRALSVQGALLNALRELGAEIRTGCRVTVVRKAIGGFEVEYERAAPYDRAPALRANRVLLATGGKAGPAYGSFGDGYGFARKLGHSVESIRPSLVPLVYAEECKERFSVLKGVRAKAKAELVIDGHTAANAAGEVQFTQDALSGIVIFDLSVVMPKSVIEGRPRVHVVLDLVPGADEDRLSDLLEAHPEFGLAGVMDKRLADFLRTADAGETAAAAKRLVVPIEGTKGWKDAQATRGGVPLSEINPETGESLICPGLFFAGEIAGRVFICGGYNLTFAWTSGIRAGKYL
ncbi:MAG: aminoacetone oxidase family FAD-binding enzyme [Clostridiales Family XIII bacterium]|jgi:predicted Rossmann fold flavoprotein|nr:aminoacetone oxidase family FAD-binding enzyme [Clostridiales Family XIII bacterium]